MRTIDIAVTTSRTNTRTHTRTHTDERHNNVMPMGPYNSSKRIIRITDFRTEVEGARESAYLHQANYQLSLETCTSNLKSVALTILELLEFNAQKFRGSHDPPFRKVFESCPDGPWEHACQI